MIDQNLMDRVQMAQILLDAVFPESAAVALRELVEAYGAALLELDDLTEWRDGAIGAAAIARPPGDGEHTEGAYATHRERYEESMTRGSGYAAGADVVSEIDMRRRDEEKQRDEALVRLRETAQILVAAVGADGPMDAEDAAYRAVMMLQRSHRDADIAVAHAHAAEAEVERLRADNPAGKADDPEYWGRMYACESERADKALRAFRRAEARAEKAEAEVERLRGALEIATVTMASVWPDDFRRAFGDGALMDMIERNRTREDFLVEDAMRAALAEKDG